MKTLIIGAGITGLSAASRLLSSGVPVTDISVVDKSRGLGGRMASRRLPTANGTATFDHGAQFFTARTEAFVQLLNSAEASGVINTWNRGFTSTEDGHLRWCGSNGMTDLCKWIATDAELNIGFQTTVVNLGEYLSHHEFDAVIHTAPVPQALATLNGSGLLPAPPVERQLAGIQYHATISVLLATSVGPTGMATGGATQFVDHPDLAFIGDNQAKGISTVPAVTIHLSHERSESLWLASDEEVVRYAVDAAANQLGDASDPAELLASSVQRWRYAEPISLLSEGCVMWGSAPTIVFAGEAFSKPRVEGGFISGCAAADALMRVV